MIESFKKLQNRPKIFIVTDKPEAITKEDFVFVSDIKNYNEKYLFLQTRIIKISIS